MSIKDTHNSQSISIKSATTPTLDAPPRNLLPGTFHHFSFSIFLIVSKERKMQGHNKMPTFSTRKEKQVRESEQPFEALNIQLKLSYFI